MVGDGTSGSCDEAELEARLAGGGLVTFNCHPADLPIVITDEKLITANTQVDGGGMVTLDAQGSTRIFVLGNGISLDLIGITSTGGGVVASGPSTSLAASIVAGNDAPAGPNCHVLIALVSQGSNVSDDGSCSFNAAGDIQNSTAVNLGPLGPNGGSTDTLVPQSGSDAIDNADCALSTAQDQRGLDRPQGAGCDIGSVEIRQAVTYPLCASYYTGAVSSPLVGGCAPGQVEMVVPANLSFCLDPYTGAVLYLFGRPCSSLRIEHVLPDDGDLLTCVNLYTRANRWVMSHGQCTAYETPNTILAML